MRQHWLIVKLLMFILFQTSCTTRAPIASPAALPATNTNPAFEGITTPHVDALQIKKVHESFLPAQNIKDIKWSPAGNYFVVLTEERITLYETSTLEDLWSISPIAPAYYASAAAFSSDEKTLFLFTRLTGIQKRETMSGQLLAESSKNNSSAHCLLSEAVDAVLSVDDKSLYISTSIEDPQQQSYTVSEIHKWDVQKLACVSTFGKVEGNARFLGLSFDGKFLVLGVGRNTSISGNDVKEDSLIVVRNLITGQEVCRIEDQGSLARFKPESSILLVVNPERDQLVYWNVETCHVVGELSGITTRYNLTFSPDGQLLALWNNGVSIIDSSSGIVLQTIDDPVLYDVLPINRLFSFLSFSPNGKYLIYAARREPVESMVFIWAVEK